MLKICQYLKPITISLSPNVEKDDIWLALKLVFCLWKWRRGEAIEELENEFKKYLGVKYAFAFNSGRACLMAILRGLNLEPGSEILLQAFTCNAAVNPVIWSGLKPVYVDCDENSFNIDIEDLKKKITSKSKVIIVQHTFGLPAEMVKILEIAKQNNLILIEDCAHSLGTEYYNQKVGSFGRVAFFSFSRDKIISSVYGGMVVTNDPSLAEKLQQAQSDLDYPSHCWILQQLMHPVLMNFLILPTYRILGKYLLVLFQWFKILSKAVHWKEKQGRKPPYFPKRMSNVLALLALNQFKKLERFNKHRKEIANFYFKNIYTYNSESRFSSGARGSYYQKLKNSSFELPEKDNSIFLRFTIKHSEAHKIIKKMWKKNILIGDWYTSPIAPDDTNLEKMGYKFGVCPKAEKLSKQTLNLPTHINISLKQAQKIINFLKTWK